MPSAARFSSLWTAGRVSGFGPSTLMCPIPVTHTHTRSYTHTHTQGVVVVVTDHRSQKELSLAATLNKELDECRWVIPQARVRTPAGTLAGTLPHGTFVAASGRRPAARQTGMALARRSLPGMPSAARFSSLWTAGRVSGFGPSTLMCPIPVTHTHTWAFFLFFPRFPSHSSQTVTGSQAPSAFPTARCARSAPRRPGHCRLVCWFVSYSYCPQLSGRGMCVPPPPTPLSFPLSVPPSLPPSCIQVRHSGQRPPSTTPSGLAPLLAHRPGALPNCSCNT